MHINQDGAPQGLHDDAVLPRRAEAGYVYVYNSHIYIYIYI
jgi:hypothetical protein